MSSSSGRQEGQARAECDAAPGWPRYTPIRASCEGKLSNPKRLIQQAYLPLLGSERAEPKGTAESRLSGLTEVEYAGRPQLTLLDQAERHEVALAGGVGGAGRQRGMAANQDRLPAQQPDRLL